MIFNICSGKAGGETVAQQLQARALAKQQETKTTAGYVCADK